MLKKKKKYKRPIRIRTNKKGQKYIVVNKKKYILETDLPKKELKKFVAQLRLKEKENTFKEYKRPYRRRHRSTVPRYGSVAFEKSYLTQAEKQLIQNKNEKEIKDLKEVQAKEKKELEDKINALNLLIHARPPPRPPLLIHGRPPIPPPRPPLLIHGRPPVKNIQPPKKNTIEVEVDFYGKKIFLRPQDKVLFDLGLKHLNEREKQILEQEQKLEYQEQQLLSLNQKNKFFVSQLDTRQHNLDLKEAELKELDKQNTDLSNILYTQELELKRKTTQADFLKQSLDSMIETNTNAQNKLKAKKEKIKDIKQQLIISQNRVIIAKEDFEKKQQEVNKADLELKEIERKILAASKVMSEKGKKIREGEDIIKKQREELTVEKFRLKQLASDLEEREENIKKAEFKHKKQKEQTHKSPEKEGKEEEEEEIDIEELEEKKGEGNVEKDGLWDDQIEDYMKQFAKDGWKGVYSVNELNEIPVSKKMSFIMNLSPDYKKGTHWVAVYIDAKKDMSVDYFDSFGRDPNEETLKGIKEIVDKIHSNVYLKLKINKIVDQRANSSTCGYHAMNFLLNRYKGIPFKDCSGYSNVEKGEKDAHKLESKFKKFGYI